MIHDDTYLEKLDWCEQQYMDGLADDQCGDVDSYGHFYRVGRYIVKCDGAGFVTLMKHENSAQATAIFDEIALQLALAECVAADVS